MKARLLTGVACVVAGAAWYWIPDILDYADAGDYDIPARVAGVFLVLGGMQKIHFLNE